MSEPIQLLSMFLTILAPYVGIVIGAAFLWGLMKVSTSSIPNLRPKVRTAPVKEFQPMSDFTVLVRTPDLIRIRMEPYVPLLDIPELQRKMEEELCDPQTQPLKLNVIPLDIVDEFPFDHWNGEYTLLLLPFDSCQFEETQIQSLVRWASDIISDYIKQGNERVGVTKASDYINLVDRELDGEDDLPPDPHSPSNLH